MPGPRDLGSDKFTLDSRTLGCKIVLHSLREFQPGSFHPASTVIPAHELFDLAGRQLEQRNVAALGAGRHRIGVGEARRMPPGVYLVRLSQGAESVAIRAVMVP